MVLFINLSLQIKILLESVRWLRSRFLFHILIISIVEYTPQAYLQSDLDMFNQNFSGDLMGKSPKLVSIDDGRLHRQREGAPHLIRKSNMRFCPDNSDWVPVQ